MEIIDTRYTRKTPNQVMKVKEVMKVLNFDKIPDLLDFLINEKHQELILNNNRGVSNGEQTKINN